MNSIEDNTNLMKSIQNYDVLSQEYRQKAAQKYLLEAIISGKHELPNKERMNIIRKDKIDPSFEKLKESLVLYQNLAYNYQQELLRAQTIKEDKVRFSAIPRSLPNEKANINEINDHNTFLENKKNCLTIEKEKFDSLYKGLTKLVGVREITFCNDNANNNIKFKVRFKKIEAILTLNEMKLCDIEITAAEIDMKIFDTKNILCECIKLPPPQDLRHAIFYLNSIQDMKAIFTEHIAILRKKCLIKLFENNPFLIHLTSDNGLSSLIRVHPCYPQVIGGVKVISIEGDAPQLEELRVKVNTMAISNLVDLHEQLSKI